MDFLIFIIMATVVYCTLWFLHKCFKHFNPYLHEEFVNDTGLIIGLFHVHWYTTAFNRTIIKLANKYPKMFTFAFDIGVYCAILLMPIAFFVHLISLIVTATAATAATTITEYHNSNVDGLLQQKQHLAATTTKSILNSIELEIMLPGINLPLNEILYYILALTISSVVHELGHAIAAVLEDVPVTGMGLSMFYILPIAYTEINTDQLNAIKLWSKLRIFCAGIWHNLLLAAFCYFLYLISSSILLKPFYQIGSGVIVTKIQKYSPLSDNSNIYQFNRGLMLDDVITDINGCKVKSLDSYFDCLLESIKIHPNYCINSEFILKNDESINVVNPVQSDLLIECCDKQNVKNQCYEYIPESYYSMSEIPQFMCLNIRKTAETSLGYCHHYNKEQQSSLIDGSQQQQHSGTRCKVATITATTKSSGIRKGGEQHDPNIYCIKPLLSNSTTIIHIKRHRNFVQSSKVLRRPDVIFIGHPTDVITTISVSEYVPASDYLPSEYADSYILFLKYVIVFSLGLGVVNVLPCFALDGQYITINILHYLLQPFILQRKRREQFSLILVAFGTLLFILTLLKVLWMSIGKNVF